jgi:hypothetical protein
LEELLGNPAVQGGVAPFVTALLVSLALAPLRLGGLAVIAAFAVCMYLVSGIQLTPLTATRKLLLVAVAAAALGPVVDFAFKPARVGTIALALAAGAATLWVFWPVIVQKGGLQAWLLGGIAALSVGFATGVAYQRLGGDGVRAGACALALGLGAGVGAFLAASLSYALYGVGLAAAAGGLLLPQMIRGKATFAGATLTLPATIIGMLVACGAMLLAQLPWYSVLVLALVPAAASLPGPNGAAWLQAVVFSLYGFVVVAGAWLLAWPASSAT